MGRNLAEDILSLPDDGIIGFIEENRRAKTLSGVVQALNADMLDGDADARALAEAVLDRFGLLDVA